MTIKIVKSFITKAELLEMAKEEFGDVIKAVVDVELKIMAVGGELHADDESLLIEKEGSKRENTWGVNLYLEKSEDDFIEFDSMINLKPGYGNRSRGVEKDEVREKIKQIIKNLVS